MPLNKETKPNLLANTSISRVGGLSFRLKRFWCIVSSVNNDLRADFFPFSARHLYSSKNGPQV